MYFDASHNLNLAYKGVCIRFSPDCFLCMFNVQLKTNHLNVWSSKLNYLFQRTFFAKDLFGNVIKPYEAYLRFAHWQDGGIFSKQISRINCELRCHLQSLPRINHTFHCLAVIVIHRLDSGLLKENTTWLLWLPTEALVASQWAVLHHDRDVIVISYFFLLWFADSSCLIQPVADLLQSPAWWNTVKAKVPYECCFYIKDYMCEQNGMFKRYFIYIWNIINWLLFATVNFCFYLQCILYES